MGHKGTRKTAPMMNKKSARDEGGGYPISVPILELLEKRKDVEHYF